MSRRTSVVTVWFLLMVVGVVVADARASAWSSRTAIEASVDGGQRIEYFVLDPAELVSVERAPCDARSSHDLPRYWRVGRGGLPAPRAP
ncbi:MAG: hypothetical protein KDB80_12910 [Planctomycetes bacterium]|nr:hypothetical protein [Planctomycetota bacterium]